MRQIKFKAWDGQKVFPVGSLTFNDEKYGTVVDDEAWDFAGGTDGNLLGSEKVILMQFTGLLDKNGKEIYEGDIVKTKYQPKAEMIWEEPEACFTFKTIDDVVKEDKMYGFKGMDIEIIGNIYENSELLNG